MVTLYEYLRVTPRYDGGASTGNVSLYTTTTYNNYHYFKFLLTLAKFSVITPSDQTQNLKELWYWHQKVSIKVSVSFPSGVWLTQFQLHDGH